MEFTVIGFYPDNGQRWAHVIEAEDAKDAEHKTPEDVHVVGVIAGAVDTVDHAYTYVRAGGA